MNNIPNKYCHNCGTKQNAGAKFCHSCGTSLASIDEKPPGAVAPPEVPNRVRPKAIATFRPVIAGAGEDEDDEAIQADRIQSIHELGLSLSSLDVDVQTDFRLRETVGGLMQQGSAMPQAALKVEARPAAPLDNTAFMQQFATEGGTLRK